MAATTIPAGCSERTSAAAGWIKSTSARARAGAGAQGVQAQGGPGDVLLLGAKSSSAGHSVAAKGMSVTMQHAVLEKFKVRTTTPPIWLALRPRVKQFEPG